MLELGIIADDLTGGMMVASLLEREGVRCPLVTSTEALANLDPNANAVVIGRKIRLIPSDQACADATRSALALREAGCKRIYYKYCATFDSTPKGNIGPIAEALMAALDTDRTIFCPAFPEYSVTVFQGRMFLGGVMLGESAKQHDPVTPMTNSNLVEVLAAQSTSPVGLISHGVLGRGREAAAVQIQRQVDQGTGLFIIDAADNDDVTAIAELTSEWALTTGADALPMYLARTWLPAGQKVAQRTLLPPSPGKEAVLAGSCASGTLRQLEHFEKSHPVYRIDLVAAATDSHITNKVRDWAARELQNGPVAIATSSDVPGVERAQQALGVDGAAALADKLLGQAAEALHELGVRKFVVAGGETSGQVMSSLGVERVQVSSFDELSGGYCHQAGPDPVSLVLKAGALGDPQFFFTALERMRAADRNQ
ncbi:MAG: four-carbon acid sugar kinase family protein [Proteobacteria bacterium]|nr:four-carbon acid sugar kinase family protein [Pseudomonadota bacterium]